jgi:hypothetical protein
MFLRKVRLAFFLVSILSSSIVLAQLSSTQTNPPGTVGFTTEKIATSTCGSPAIALTYTGWYFTDSQNQTHTFPGTSSSCDPLRYATLDRSFTAISTDGLYSLTADGPEGTVVNTNTFNPLFKITSILYSPPGNQSTEGYTDTSTTGTTTTIGSSFTTGVEETFTTGIKDVLSASASWGFTQGSTNTSAFTETWTDALSVATDDNSSATYNPAASNAINHNLDTFEIWLNPTVTILSQGTTPISYTANSLPTPGVSALVADIIGVPAIDMEPAPAGITTLNPTGAAGVTTVPVSSLIPQAIPNDQGTGNAYMPGLAAICQNRTLYQQQLANPATLVCTQTNQCGCAPSDFSAILTNDTLLGYNPATLTATPYAGTETPLDADGSGSSVCSANTIPTTSDCRYVIVPISPGSSTPQLVELNGAQSDMFQQSDSTASTVTTGTTSSTNVGISYSEGPLVASLKIADTWTWADSQSTGATAGQAHTMAVTLKTSTATCDEWVNVFEDTVYHTYLFQIPTGYTGCP